MWKTTVGLLLGTGPLRVQQQLHCCLLHAFLSHVFRTENSLIVPGFVMIGRFRCLLWHTTYCLFMQSSRVMIYNCLQYLKTR